MCSGTRRERFVTLLIVVVMIALPLRLFVASRAEMISRDGAVFIWYAQGLQQNPLAELRAQKQHPLYPGLILATHQVLRHARSVVPALPADPVKSWIAAAVAVTLIGGLAVVVAVYLLARTLFDERVALLAALLAAVTADFCQLSGDALTDMPHLAMYLFALAAGVRGVRDRSYPWLAAAGLLSGMAYLIRPEGAEAAVVAVVGALLLGRNIRLRRRITGALVVCLAAGLVASPYMAVTGKLVPKKSLGQLFWGHAEVQSRPVGPSLPLGALTCAKASVSGKALVDLGRAEARIAENWARSLRVTLLLPAILWLAMGRRMPCRPTPGRLVAGAIVLHVVILTALIVHFDYWKFFSLRHVLVLAGLTLPFSAAGVAWVLDAVPANRRSIAMVALAAGLIGPTLPWMCETRLADQVHIRQAGQWIRAHDDRPPRIMTTRFRAALYAGGIHVWCPPENDPGWILAEARDRRPDWLVFETTRLPQDADNYFETLKKSVLPGEHLERVAEIFGPGPKSPRAVIFRYQAPP